jgi:regulation of enolase protein 1 (concanavalin A-like superfamily)
MGDQLLHEAFDKPGIDPRLRWHCEPARWSVDTARRCLRIEPDDHTDFWQRTLSGIEADNGHLLFAEVTGDFTLTTHVRFDPVHQYDQAGLMVRLSPTCWLKTSVEYEPDGPSRLGAVVTNQAYSDWSTQDFPANRGEIGLRIRRRGGDYVVEAAEDDQRWTQIRLAHLHEDRQGATIAAGLYACSPKGAGMVAEFSFLRIDRGGDS